MDGVVDVDMAARLSDLGALGVLNLEGVQTRYEDPNAVLDRIAAVGKDEFVPLMQEIYSQPVQESLIRQRIQEIKAKGGIGCQRNTRRSASVRQGHRGCRSRPLFRASNGGLHEPHRP